MADARFTHESSDQLQTGRASDFRYIYSNQSRARLTNSDLTLTFSFIADMPGGANYIEERVAIVLAPQHAKLLAQALTEAVAAFERQFGEIHVVAPPPSADQIVAGMVEAKARSEQKPSE
jgi:hypothetical protein